MIGEALFYMFALLALGGAILVVWNPFSGDPVVRVLMFGVAMAGVAGLFVLLGAEFLGFAHLFIYGGAIVVMLVFMLMLVGRTEKRHSGDRLRSLLGLVAGTVLASGLGLLFMTREAPTSPRKFDSVSALPDIVKEQLETYWVLLPVIGLMVFLGTVGVIMYSQSVEEDTRKDR